VVVVIDTLRADRLGVYGNSRGLTPFLDALAQRGTLFRHAYATSSWTSPSVASIFTSRYPLQHSVTTWDSKLPEAERTLAEELGGRGYINLGFTANLRLTTELGWSRGFRTWGIYPSVTKLPANRLRRIALRSLDAVRSTPSTAPVFLYLQYMEPHSPYDPPMEYARRFGRADTGIDPRRANERWTPLGFEWKDIAPGEIELLASLYDAEVAYVDHELARMFAGLEARGLFRDAIVVVTADHGEQLGEHKLMGHGVSLFNQELHVPLLVVGRGVPAGRVVEDNVSLVDLAPTVLALAGVPGDARFEGRSLAPLLSKSGPTVDVFAELARTSTDTDMDGRQHTAAIVRGMEKLVLLAPPWVAALGRSGALYDLATDPGETRPVVLLGGPSSPEGTRAEELAAALLELQHRLAKAGVTTPEHHPLEDEQRRRLRALGYAN
jgi:arylsulfatase A-like enzyme